MLNFEAHPISELSPVDVHALMMLRAEVFVVEQDCVYQDPDTADLHAVHLLGREHGRLVAYARWFLNEELGLIQLGRVVTARDRRRSGIGSQLMRRALDAIAMRPVLIHAQVVQEDWYAGFGFVPEGDPFLEDGITHRRMLLPSDPSGPSGP